MHNNKYPLPRFSVNRPITVVMSLVSLCLAQGAPELVLNDPHV